jgi:hypothetical protein
MTPMLQRIAHRLIFKHSLLIGLLLITNSVVAEDRPILLASNCQSPLCFENQDATFQFKVGVRLQLDLG